jgi:hypothetical protein
MAFLTNPSGFDIGSVSEAQEEINKLELKWNCKIYVVPDSIKNVYKLSIYHNTNTKPELHGQITKLSIESSKDPKQYLYLELDSMIAGNWGAPDLVGTQPKMTLTSTPAQTPKTWYKPYSGSQAIHRPEPLKPWQPESMEEMYAGPPPGHKFVSKKEPTLEGSLITNSDQTALDALNKYAEKVLDQAIYGKVLGYGAAYEALEAKAKEAKPWESLIESGWAETKDASPTAEKFIGKLPTFEKGNESLVEKLKEKIKSAYEEMDKALLGAMQDAPDFNHKKL